MMTTDDNSGRGPHSKLKDVQLIHNAHYF